MPPLTPRLIPPSTIQCSHCKVRGHNIAKCNIFNIKFHISLLTHDESILIPGRGLYGTKHINARLLADFKLLYTKKVSNITYNNQFFI